MSVNQFEQPLAVLALESLDGNLAVVQVPQTRPPGARVSVQLAGGVNGEGVVLHGKVVGQVRLSPEVLRMSIRMNNLSKTDRAFLQTYLNESNQIV